MINDAYFLDYVGYLLAAVSIIWSLHGTMIWKARDSSGGNRRLALGLFVVTLVGLANLILLLQLLAWAAEGKPVASIWFWLRSAGWLTSAFMLLVGVYHILVLVEFALRRPRSGL